jgi:hypothetical protein
MNSAPPEWKTGNHVERYQSYSRRSHILFSHIDREHKINAEADASMKKSRIHREPAHGSSNPSVATLRWQDADSSEIYCQMCGISVGDIDEYTGKQAKFRAALVPNNGLGLRSIAPNLRVLCSTCNQGAKNVTGEKPSTIWLLSQVRRAGIDEQKAVFDFLSKKLNGISAK